MAGRAFLCSSLIAFCCTYLGSSPAEDGQLSAVLVPIADTGLYEIAPTNNLGRVAEIPAGVHSGSRRSRYLVRFDPTAALPADAVITAAELSIQVTVAGTPSAVYQVHRLLRDWSEGDKTGNNGAPATAGESTWLARFHASTPWAAPGASNGIDYVDVPSATVTLGDSGSINLVGSTGLASDVQLWLQNPGTNFGWLVRAQDETTSQTVRRLGSRETGTNSPALTLSYRVGPRLHSMAISNDLFRFCFLARSNQAYRVEHAGALSDERAWQSMTNVMPATADRELCFGQDLTSTNRFYRVVEEE